MATATSKLQIIIDVLTGDSEKEVSGIDSAVKDLAAGLTFAAGTLTAFGIAAKKAFDLGKEGAELELTAERFDKLAASIGTTGDALLQDLGPAMGGMLSDAEMMAAATDLMALGLVKTHDEAVRLASVAGQLGMDMNQLVLTMTNQTTMRFDALGVSVDGFDEKVQALIDTGMDANDAFNEAFLQQAEEQLEKVGSAADTAAGEFARMEAEFKNFTDSAKVMAMEAMLPIVESFNDATEYADLLNQALADGVITQDEYGEAMLRLEFNTANVNEATEELTQKMEDTAAGTEDADSNMLKLADSMELVLDAYEAVGPVTDKYAEAQEKAQESAALGAEAQRELAAATEAAAEASQSALAAMQEYMSVFDQTDAAEEADAVIDATVDHLLEQADAAAAAGLSIDPYIEAIRELDPATADALEESAAFSDTLAVLDELYASGAITGEDYAEAVQNMASAIEAGIDPTIAMQTEMAKFRDIMSESQGTAAGLQGSLDALVAGSPYEIEVHTTYTESGSAPSTGGGDTGTTSTGSTDDAYAGDFQHGTDGWQKVTQDGAWITMHAGEQFAVVPPGESVPGGVKIYQTNNVTNTNPMVAAMNQAFIDASLINEFRAQL